MKLSQSIVFKTTFILIVSLSIVASILGWFIYDNQINIIKELQKKQKSTIFNYLDMAEKTDIDNAVKNLRLLSKSLVGAIATSLYNTDEESAKDTLKKFMNNENIKAVEIYDSSVDEIFLIAYKNENKMEFLKEFPSELTTFKFIKFDLVADDEDIGYFKVFYDNSSIVKRIRELKEKDLEEFEKDVIATNKKISERLKKQILWMILGGLFIVIIIIFLLKRFVNKPLVAFKKGLQSFFDYLADPKKRVEPIEIDTDDEFGQMSKSVNESIQVSMKMHSNLSNLMATLDKYVITSETDKKGVITNVSTAFCEISGYSKEELIGNTHKIMRHPDMKKELYDDLWQTIKSNKPWVGEIKNLKKNGESYWVQVVISPKCSADGTSCGYTAIRYDITDKKEVENLKANLEIKVEERTKDLEVAKKEIEAIHKHTRESIEYASLIQGALLPESSSLNKFFKDEFVIWHPKDTVGGDIWLFDRLRNDDECLLFVIDCTGHGVPGAFVTMIVKAIEREIVSIIKEDKEMDVSPAWVMSYFNKTMKHLLKQESKDSLSNAGFDGGIIYYNRKTQILKFAGAETPLFYVDTEGEFHTIKGNRYSVGYKKCDMNYNYKETVLEVQEGMKFYITTDGYLDQNGGEKDFPFGKKRFGNIIKKHYQEPMNEIREFFLYEMEEYESMIPDNERNDDMTVIGFEIDERSTSPDIILEYEGILTQNIIGHNVDILEHTIDNISLLGKLTTLTIELTQNMMNYSKSHELNCRDIRPAGYIQILKTVDDIYIVKSKNIVSIEDKEKIEPKLQEIISLDSAGLKKRYRELRRSGENTHGKGGGIGFYEIAKLSQNIKFDFERINDEKFYFHFEVQVASKKKRA